MVNVGASLPWIDNELLKIYQLRQSNKNEGFDPGMCRSDPMSTIGRLADVSWPSQPTATAWRTPTELCQGYRNPYWILDPVQGKLL